MWLLSFGTKFRIFIRVGQESLLTEVIRILVIYRSRNPINYGSNDDRLVPFGHSSALTRLGSVRNMMMTAAMIRFPANHVSHSPPLQRESHNMGVARSIWSARFWFLSTDAHPEHRICVCISESERDEKRSDSCSRNPRHLLLTTTPTWPLRLGCDSLKLGLAIFSLRCGLYRSFSIV